MEGTYLNELTTYIKHLLKEDPLFQEPTELQSIEKRVAYNVKRMRKERKITQIDLAEAMGVKQPFIARIESGRNNISIKKLEKLAEVLCIDPATILRPIYEKGGPDQIARIIVNRHLLVMAVNRGGERLLGEPRERLLGKMLQSEAPLKEWVENLLRQDRDIEEISFHEGEASQYGMDRVFIQTIRSRTTKAIGAELTCYLRNVTGST